jgi:prolyl-tRNA editing enzyme YbaK/EbsC (Cys-tRNA(Pro) deacylase)
VKPATHPSALKVQAVLGSSYKVLEFDASTKTAADAAAAVGCDVGQIAKSVIFKATASDRAVLVINRVDEKKVAALLGEKLERADADFVREKTGFAIGGVPPVGHATQSAVMIDRSLANYVSIWAAAGTPHAVFELTFNNLVALTAGLVTDVAKSPASP